MSENVEKKKYWEDAALTTVVEQVRQSGQFPDAEDFKIRVLYVNGKPPEEGDVAAKCIKVADHLRVISHVDFVLLFWKSAWDLMVPETRFTTICHELHHIDQTENGKPKIRRHGGDFCEIPEHDKESRQLAKMIEIPSLLAKAPMQATLSK